MLKQEKQVNLKHRSINLLSQEELNKKHPAWCKFKLDEQLIAIESALHNKYREIPYAENILSISGMERVYCSEYWQK